MAWGTRSGISVGACRVGKLPFCFLGCVTSRSLTTSLVPHIALREIGWMPTPTPPSSTVLSEFAAEPGAWVGDSCLPGVYGIRSDRVCGSTAPSTGEGATLLGVCFFLTSRWRRVLKACNFEGNKFECGLQLPQLPLNYSFKFPVKM